MSKEWKRHQTLVTMRIPKEVRDALKELAKKEQRSMVGQLTYMVEKANSNG